MRFPFVWMGKGSFSKLETDSKQYIVHPLSIYLIRWRAFKLPENLM